jgi:hypothetical protein
MRQIVVDTNVLVSFLTDRNLQQQEKAGFSGGSRGELSLVIHQIVITEMVYVLLNLYSVPSEDVAQTLDEFLSLPGVQGVDTISWTSVLRCGRGRFPASRMPPWRPFCDRAGTMGLQLLMRSSRNS